MSFLIKLSEVALHPEGVDRNTILDTKFIGVTMSPSTRRAWIEISSILLRNAASLQSPSTRRAWIEIIILRLLLYRKRSPSTRRAWIEILIKLSERQAGKVALHPEGVDRNRFKDALQPAIQPVALHPEGVDRNKSISVYIPTWR